MYKFPLMQLVIYHIPINNNKASGGPRARRIFFPRLFGVTVPFILVLTSVIEVAVLCGHSRPLLVAGVHILQHIPGHAVTTQLDSL